LVTSQLTSSSIGSTSDSLQPVFVHFCGNWDHLNCSVFFSPAGNLVIDMGSDFVDGAFCITDQRGYLILLEMLLVIGYLTNIFWQPKGGCGRRLCRLIRHSHWKHPHFNAFTPSVVFQVWHHRSFLSTSPDYVLVAAILF
jgi:hypothetical protein